MACKKNKTERVCVEVKLTKLALQFHGFHNAVFSALSGLKEYANKHTELDRETLLINILPDKYEGYSEN